MADKKYKDNSPEAEERRRSFKELVESLPPIEPCIYCGRIVLIGWCCEKKLNDKNYEENEKKYYAGKTSTT
jgi:hypothetical protein